MTDYAQELASRSSAASIASSVARTKVLLETFRAWIDKYRGGIPNGWAAAIMYWESDGNFNAPGDASLGEVGYYQVAAYVPAQFGVAADARLDPETNVFLGLLEYQFEVAQWKAAFPDLVKLASDDAWKLARLSFSVGRGGAFGLAKLVQGSAYPGALYDAIADYVRTNGGVQLGGQSPDQVWFRVLSIAVQWEIGRQASSLFSTSGPPMLVTPPAGVTYTIPYPFNQFFTSSSSDWFFFGAIATASYFLWRLTR